MKVINLLGDIKIESINGKSFIINGNNRLSVLENGIVLQVGTIVFLNNNTVVTIESVSGSSINLLNSDQVEFIDINTLLDSNRIQLPIYNELINNLSLPLSNNETLNLEQEKSDKDISSSITNDSVIDYDNDQMLAVAGFETSYYPIKKTDEKDDSYEHINHIEDPFTVGAIITASITIDNITADDIINIAESKTDIIVHGSVGNDVKVGDTVTVLVGTQSYITTVQADNTWTVNVPGQVLVDNGTDNVKATVTTTDIAGNSATANADHSYTVDTTIAAAIVIDSISHDDVVTAAESSSLQVITGTVGDDVKAGDIVTVSLDGDVVGTTTAIEQNGQLVWSLSVDGKTLLQADVDRISASVTTDDIAGNTATANTSHNYSIDVKASITINPITGDDKITEAEAHQPTLPISGTVGQDVQVGDQVIVSVNGHDYTTSVQAGKIWSVDVLGRDILHADTATATVTTDYGLPHEVTATTTEDYTIEITAGIIISSIAGDNIVNNQETESKVPITGLVGGDVNTGDIVTVTINGITYTTKVSADKTWVVDVDGSALVNNKSDDVHASVITNDGAGHQATATTEKPYTVNTTIAASITIDNITADNIINIAESKTDIAVHGTVGDDVKVGDTVVITAGTQVYSTTVQAGNTWTVNIPGKVLVDNGTDNIKATVTTTDSVGNIATANTDHLYTVDTTIAASISIDNITADDIINIAESKTDIAVHGTVGDDVKVGDTVTVIVGSETYTTTVKTGAKWTVNVPGQVLVDNGTDDVKATVITTDIAGNTTTANAEHPYSVDTTIAASIVIDTISHDDVVTAIESSSLQVITGTVGDDVKAGDTVTVALDNNVLGTATVIEQDGQLVWSLEVDGETLLQANVDRISASVTIDDVAGNTATANTSHGYTIDIKASITINPITGDDKITEAEAHQSTLPITGTVGQDVQVGDQVVVSVNGHDYTTTVQAGNTWSVDVLGRDILHADEATATVTTNYGLPHEVTATATEDYTIEITAGIIISSIAGDNIVNKQESEGTVPITGLVGGDVNAGDTVTVTINDISYTTIVSADKTWVVDVDGSVLVNNSSDDVHASVTTNDGAGHQATATTEKPYTVDVIIAASISIDNITADDIINIAESKVDIAVHGTVGDDVKVGDTVTITVGTQTYTTIVQTGNTWTVNVPGQVLVDSGTDNVKATVTTTDIAGNTATANADHPYTVDTTIAASITIDNITADDIINIAESKTDIAVHGSVGDDVKVGDTVIITVGTRTYTTTVQAGGTWTVNVPGHVLVDNGSDNVKATVTTTDIAGNTATANADHPYSVDTTISASITIDNITADDIINMAESKTDIAVHGCVGDDVKVGDIVTVTVDAETYTTAVQAGNTWTVNVAGQVLVDNGTDNVKATVTTTDIAGNSATANAEHPYSVDTTIAASIVIDSISHDDVVTAAESSSSQLIIGSVGDDVKVGDIVTVSLDGAVVGTTTVIDQNGHLIWSLDIDGETLLQANVDRISASVTAHDVAGNVASANTSHNYTIDVKASITINPITGDDKITEAEAHQSTLPITGTVGQDVQVGDQVVVSVNGHDYSTTVQAGNIWSVDVLGRDILHADEATATVTTNYGLPHEVTATTTEDYTIVITADIIISSIAGDDIVNKQESETTVPITGLVGGDVNVGDTVTVTINGTDYTTTVNADKTWIVDVDGSALVNNSSDDVHASVTTNDGAGHQATATTERPYTVDTIIAASIIIDNITADDIINIAESKANIAVHGTVGDDVKVGDTVTIVVGTQTYTTTVQTGNTWTVNVPGQVLVDNGTDNVKATVTTTDIAGNIATANADHSYTVDTTIAASITIDNITADDIINIAESKTDIAVHGSVGDDVKVGDTVTIVVGTQTYTTTVQTGNTWTVNVPGQVLVDNGTDNVKATVTITDLAGNTATANAEHAYSVDTSITASITIDNITADDIINMAESKTDIAVHGSVGDDVKVGDTVTITVGTQTYTTTVETGNIWTVNVPGQVLVDNGTDNVKATVTTTDIAGNVATANANHPYTVDITIAASIVIDTISGDDIVTAAESSSSQVITGTVGDDVKAGDIVTVSLDGAELGTTTVLEQNGQLVWSLDVDGKTLLQAGVDRISASVTAHDVAGNTATANTSHSYTIDIKASITINPITGDNKITEAEAHQSTLPITGTVGKDVQVGDQVVVSVNGHNYTTTVQTGNTWSVEVLGRDILHADEATATVTTNYGLPHEVTATTTEDYTIVITADIIISSIAGDNIVNKQESEGIVAITGLVGGDVNPDDIVTVTINGTSYTTKVSADKTWVVNVDGSVLVNNSSDDVIASVTTNDGAGHQASATTEKPYTIDTIIAASIIIDNITADNIINIAESKTDIAVHGTVGDDVKVGDTVTITVGTQTYTTTVQTGDTWTVNVPGQVLVDNGTDNVKASVTTTDIADNVATANADHPYTVDTSIAASIIIDNITADNIINIAESKTDIAVHGSVGDDVKVGDTVTIIIGTKTYTTTVQMGNTWTVNVPGQVLVDNGTDDVKATVTTTDIAGNVATANAEHSYTIKTLDASITINNVTADNVINESEATQDLTINGDVGGGVKLGDQVTVTVIDHTYFTHVISVNGQLVWQVDIPGSILATASVDDINAAVTATDMAGNSVTATASHQYQVADLDVTITIDMINDGKPITGTEYDTNTPITVMGTVGGDAKVGDTVTLQLGDKKVETVVITLSNGNLGYTTSVAGQYFDPSSDNGFVGDIHASITINDSYQNIASAQADKTYGAEGDVIIGTSASEVINGSGYNDVIIGDSLISQPNINVSLVLDTSGSMAQVIIDPNNVSLNNGYTSGEIIITNEFGETEVFRKFDTIKELTDFYNGAYSEAFLHTLLEYYGTIRLPNGSIQTLTYNDLDVNTRIGQAIDAVHEISEHYSNILNQEQLDNMEFSLITFAVTIEKNERFFWDFVDKKFITANGETLNDVLSGVVAYGATNDFNMALAAGIDSFTNSDDVNVIYFISDGLDGSTDLDLIRILAGDNLDYYHPIIIPTLIGSDVTDTIPEEVRQIASLGNDYLPNNEGDSKVILVKDITQLGDSLNNAFDHILTGLDVIHGGAGNDIIVGDTLNNEWLMLQYGSDISHLQDLIDNGTSVKDILFTVVANENNITVNDVTTQDVYKYVDDNQTNLFETSSNTDSGADTLFGDAGDDIVAGSGGNDVINGGTGNDLLMGQNGNDTLISIGGNDILSGGDGDDIFQLDVLDSSQASATTIKAIDSGDKIDMSSVLDEDLSITSLLDNITSATVTSSDITLTVDHNSVTHTVKLEAVTDVYSDLGSSTTEIVTNLFNYDVFTIK
ncbi:Ig-like domain-containing protein [Photobacterium phosphoreum]|uniref:Ig-like domain-containing protein n=1 Tax=Photobacterium phosphoreum TaxID=659 RepID=UPI0039B02015